MSPLKLRKTRKLRGSRTVGWGQVGQHRKQSQKGGRKVGRHKHLWTYVVKYEPDYFGKKGFTSVQSLKEKVNVINIRKLDELFGRLTLEKRLERKEGKAFIDLTAFGYNKLLATGKIEEPILVKVQLCTQKAAEKIEQAGGQILKDEDIEKTKTSI